MAGMVQASTSAASSADKVWAGTVLAADRITVAALSITTAAAINPMGQAFTFKLKGAVGATEPLTDPHELGPPFQGGLCLRMLR